MTLQELVNALHAKNQDLKAENLRLSNLVCDWRDKCAKQMGLRVEADQRAGRKNVAKLEARIAELEAALAEHHSQGCRSANCSGC